MKGRFFIMNQYYYFWTILFVICCLYAIFSPRKPKEDGSKTTHNISFPSAIGLLVIGCIIGLFVFYYFMIRGFNNNPLSQDVVDNTNVDIKTDIVSNPMAKEVIDLDSLIQEEPFEYGTKISFYDYKIILPSFYVKQNDGWYYDENTNVSVLYLVLPFNYKDEKTPLEEYFGRKINDNYFEQVYGFDTSNPDEYYIYNTLGYDLDHWTTGVNEPQYCCYSIVKFKPEDYPKYTWDSYNYIELILGYDSKYCYISQESIYEDIDYYLNDRGGGYWEKECSPLSYKSLANKGFENVAIYYYGFEPEY